MVTGISGSSLASADLNAIWQKLLKSADQDGDGRINKDEFKTLVSEAGKGPNAEDMFSHVDASGDGYIDATENETALKSMGQHRPPGMPDPSALFQEADTDRDGALSKAEFTAMGEAMQSRAAGMGGPPGGGGGVGEPGGAGSALQSVLNTLTQSGNAAGSTSSDPADTNGDGKVSLQELIAYYTGKGSQTGQNLQSQTGTTLELTA